MSHRSLAALALTASALALATPAAAAPPAATLYEHPDFVGIAQGLAPGRYDVHQLTVGNDRTSSVRVPPGLKVTLFEHGAFGGRRLELTDNVARLPAGFNDQVSAVVVELLAPPAPPPPVPPPPAPAAQRRPIEAGPLWHDGDAKAKCPGVCAPHGRWTGGWWTTVQGRMSVCECELGGAPPPPLPPPQPVPPPPPPQPLPPPTPKAMDAAAFDAFAQRVKSASSPKSQIAAVGDQVAVGSRFDCGQVVAVMQIVSFANYQVEVAARMWPAVVDPENLPAVLASLSHEAHRNDLRKRLKK